jgi:predicted glutamine amidotransferase
MCRWMAYKGKQIFIEDWLLNSQHSLIEQSFSAEMSVKEVNGDGFGLGWYDQKAIPGLYRSILPAWNNANLKSLASNVRSGLFIAHVRAATGTPIQETNSHPFQYRNWLMVHNGIIHGFSQIKKDLMEQIDSQYFGHILGSTDSELLFFLLLSNGLEQDQHTAIQKTIALIEKIANDYQIFPAIRMTLGISNGISLWCVRYSSQSDSSTLFYSLLNQQSAERVLVVSEPINDCSIDWQPVAEDTIMHFDQSNQMSTYKIERSG